MSNETAKRSREVKFLTKLRLLIAGITQASMLSPAKREDFAAATPWHPNMPMIPAEWSRPLSEVRDLAREALAGGGDTVFVPVLRDPELTDGVPMITACFFTSKNVDDFWSEEVSSMHGGVTMEDLVATLSPDKKWDYRDLESVGPLKTLIDIV
ncbi:hypothetical protein M5J20_08525 [Corynebacterium sp. TA-R-1]|uniref:Uncharacterized protein n=1 Tax=Corynebacterium stercoris TaxID=2943490 RepID=A0ABT1G2L1_9CORY|nr:hypothetical protein [Corynebacterium stercoris]MCP1388226.1 hypothetical protein [Corynebacterium stercoris]